ncbi:AAA family ATPase [Jiella pacifica]|uniref:AAA family ATPase n=1 Tax=Jiella pacifica TaxID=2696469 RepID=A0A6N9TES1_9HYPH|nr:AAA family ATPase [Jiella pacifica]NDW07358.1 AAA family ATPase [Jiella pacifica]
MNNKIGRIVGKRRPQPVDPDDIDMLDVLHQDALARVSHASDRAIHLANPGLPDRVDVERSRLVVIRAGDAWALAARRIATTLMMSRPGEFATRKIDGSPSPLEPAAVISALAQNDALLRVCDDDEIPEILRRLVDVEIDARDIGEPIMTEILRRRFSASDVRWPADLVATEIDCRMIDLAIEQGRSAGDAIEILRILIDDADRQGSNAEAEAPEPRREESDHNDPVVRVLQAPAADAPATTATKAMWQACGAIAGRDLPLVTAITDPTAALVDEWPHAADVVRKLLATVRFGEVVRLKPTLLVGAPGTGKTSLLQAICEILDVPHVIFPCASSGDNSFGGTPARWHSSQLSTPGEAIRQHGVANPVIVLDELEKAGRHWENGSLVDALLPMLEAHTARAYYEAAIDAQIDLSHVSFLATANTLSIPAPLRDRFDIVRMPDPGPEHVGPIARKIVDDIRRRRGLLDGMITPIAPDEEELLRRAWKGGSLRQLSRIVETLVDGRDAFEIRN